MNVDYKKIIKNRDTRLKILRVTGYLLSGDGRF